MTTAAADAPADTATPDTTPSADDTGGEPDPTPKDTPPADTVDDTAKWKSLARKHENESRKLAKQIADLQAAQMSDQDKAINEAKQTARAEALSEVAVKLAAAELRAAGVPAEYLDDLNLARYVTDDGGTDGDLIAATAAKFSALTAAKPAAPQVPTGPQNGGGSKSQLTRDDLARMTPEQIVKADEEGRLDGLYGNR